MHKIIYSNIYNYSLYRGSMKQGWWWEEASWIASSNVVSWYRRCFLQLQVGFICVRVCIYKENQNKRKTTIIICAENLRPKVLTRWLQQPAIKWLLSISLTFPHPPSRLNGEFFHPLSPFFQTWRKKLTGWHILDIASICDCLFEPEFYLFLLIFIQLFPSQV